MRVRAPELEVSLVGPARVSEDFDDPLNSESGCSSSSIPGPPSDRLDGCILPDAKVSFRVESKKNCRTHGQAIRALLARTKNGTTRESSERSSSLRFPQVHEGEVLMRPPLKPLLAVDPDLLNEIFDRPVSVAVGMLERRTWPRLYWRHGRLPSALAVNREYDDYSRKELEIGMSKMSGWISETEGNTEGTRLRRDPLDLDRFLTAS